MSATQKPVNIPHRPNPETGDSSISSLSAPFTQRRGQPFLFLILDPNGQPAFDHVLALHTNPNSVTERMTKSKNVVMTYGGFVEFNWPDELDALSASHSTGAFLGPEGLVSGFDRLDASLDDADRKNTIAWERAEDLLEIFRNNGLIYDGFGKPVLRGTVQLMYDRGIFRGFFTSFSINEDSLNQFSFQLDWEFKVEQTIYRFPASFVSRDASLIQTAGQSAINRAVQQEIEALVRPEISSIEVGIPGETSESFTTNSVASAALKELEVWKGGLKETDPAAEAIIRGYWESTGQAFPPKGVEESWSAAFISHVMKNSGVPNSLIPSGAHIFYSRQAFKDRGVPGRYGAFRPDEVQIEPGDIVVRGRPGGQSFSFEDLQKGGDFIPTHGDVVTDVTSNGATLVGGNIRNDVSTKSSTLSGGFIKDPAVVAVLKFQKG
jgi:hypothetical protein